MTGMTFRIKNGAGRYLALADIGYVWTPRMEDALTFSWGELPEHLEPECKRTADRLVEQDGLVILQAVWLVGGFEDDELVTAWTELVHF